jgi:regulatory protein
VNELKEIDQPLNLAIRYLSYQPRTIFEVKRYLKKKKFNNGMILKVIDFLIEKQYLDDKAFAKLFIESKVKYKAKSKFAFRYELKNKGIKSLIIDNILSDYNDFDLAVKSLERKVKLWHNLETEKFKKKTMNFLKYRGFNYDICMSVLNHFKEQRNDLNED